MKYTSTWPDGTRESVTLLELNGSSACILRACGPVYVPRKWLKAKRRTFLYSKRCWIDAYLAEWKYIYDQGFPRLRA